MTLGYGRITGYLTTVLRIGSTDQTVPLSGTMNLLPKTTHAVVDGPQPTIVLPSEIWVAVNNGWIEDDEHHHYVDVVATNTQNMSPPEFFYEATFNLKFENRRVRFGPFTFYVPEGKTMDLSELTPIPNSQNLYTPGLLNGLRGLSAYELAVMGGYTGTLQQWQGEFQRRVLVLHTGDTVPPNTAEDTLIVFLQPGEGNPPL